MLASDVRVDPREGAAVRSEAVHVYGSHELSARDWQNYFALYSPTAVEWVSLRSCELLARRCLLNLQLGFVLHHALGFRV